MKIRWFGGNSESEKENFQNDRWATVLERELKDRGTWGGEIGGRQWNAPWCGRMSRNKVVLKGTKCRERRHLGIPCKPKVLSTRTLNYGGH